MTSALKPKVRAAQRGLSVADDADEANAWWNDAFMLTARRLKRKAAAAAAATDSAASAADAADAHDDVAPIAGFASTTALHGATARRRGVVDPLCPLYSRFVRATHSGDVETLEVRTTTTTTTTTSTTTVQHSSKRRRVAAGDADAVDVSRATFEACGGKAARYMMPDAKLARVALQDQLARSGAPLTTSLSASATAHSSPAAGALTLSKEKSKAKKEKKAKAKAKAKSANDKKKEAKREAKREAKKQAKLEAKLAAKRKAKLAARKAKASTGSKKSKK